MEENEAWPNTLDGAFHAISDAFKYISELEERIEVLEKELKDHFPTVS